ncbi:MAG: thiamine pyrophosphate-requiring protein [Gammaproteobacteria bacterium]|nr:thiamine pyrophosphate-requiring protein [Gammaproteobacteria bacterium]
MSGADLVAEILRREQVPLLACYPRNPLIDACARAGIRPIICRQERVGVGIADGYSRASDHQGIGVFASQHGPGIENAFPGIAQAYADGVPLLVLPAGDSLSRPSTPPVFYPAEVLAPVTKWSARVQRTEDLPMLLRRAFQQLRSGAPGPVLLELPDEILRGRFAGPIDYRSPALCRFGPDPDSVQAAARLLAQAECPVIWAGQGVLRANATAALVDLAEAIAAPVLTTNPGKSAFPEDHDLSLGAGAVNAPEPLRAWLQRADLVLAIGSSLTTTPFNPGLPANARVIHATVNPADLNKDRDCELALLGDARLTLEALLAALPKPAARTLRLAAVRAEVRRDKTAWLERWRSQLDDGATPINPYRLIRDLHRTVDPANTIITHDAGSPREHLVPFWETPRPRGYLGWGKSTQLGHGLGLTLGAKLAHPERLCIHWQGDAAFCMVGLDLDTAVRNRIGTLSIVLNNGVMACERDHLIDSRQRYDAFDIGGDYAAIASALGVWSRRVEQPEDFIPVLREAIAMTEAGKPALIECMTKQCHDFAG